MNEPSQDIFNQIDALLGKRGTEALSEQSLLLDDFPTLTEVIQTHETPSDAIVEPDFVGNQPPTERRKDDRRAMQRRKSPEQTGESPIWTDDQIALLSLLESKLNEMFRLKQIQLEAVFRQVIRDELEKIRKR